MCFPKIKNYFKFLESLCLSAILSLISTHLTKAGKKKTYEEKMEKRFGKIEMYDTLDMSHYQLKRDPAVFKYHRSEFEKIAPNKMDFIDDKEMDYQYPVPINYEALEGKPGIVKV